MIERLDDLPPGIDGLRASGTVSEADYEAAVRPLLEDAARTHRRLRILYHVGPAFDGYTLGGAWADVRLGLRHLEVFERVAVVSDVLWIRAVLRLAGAALPCPVAIFAEAQWDAALTWLADATAGITVTRRLLAEVGVLVVEPTAALTREDFDAISRTVDPWIRSHGELHGLVLHARAFPGWENLGSLLRHVRFVREHRPHVRRVAVAADGWTAELAPMVGRHLLDANVRQFPYAELDAAIAWAAETTDAAADTDRLQRAGRGT